VRDRVVAGPSGCGQLLRWLPTCLLTLSALGHCPFVQSRYSDLVSSLLPPGQSFRVIQDKSSCLLLSKSSMINHLSLNFLTSARGVRKHGRVPVSGLRPRTPPGHEPSRLRDGPSGTPGVGRHKTTARSIFRSLVSLFSARPLCQSPMQYRTKPCPTASALRTSISRCAIS
jgi:hypothetical protein